MDAKRNREVRPRYLGETNTQEAGANADWHAHDFGQLISADRGSMYVGTSDRVLLLSPAMTVWIPPDAQHWLRFASENVMRYVDVSRDEATQIGNTCRIFTTTPLLNALFKATMPEDNKRRSLDHTDAVHALLRMEIQSAKDVPLSLLLPQDDRIRGLAVLALENPGSIRSVENWLSEASASRKTIERLFISETGFPPSQWLRQARVLHAVSLLANGQKVTTVAFDVGYDSSSAFSYMFRQTLGISPRAFMSRQNVGTS